MPPPGPTPLRRSGARCWACWQTPPTTRCSRSTPTPPSGGLGGRVGRVAAALVVACKARQCGLAGRAVRAQHGLVAAVRRRLQTANPSSPSSSSLTCPPAPTPATAALRSSCTTCLTCTASTLLTCCCARCRPPSPPSAGGPCCQRGRGAVGAWRVCVRGACCRGAAADRSCPLASARGHPRPPPRRAALACPCVPQHPGGAPHPALRRLAAQLRGLRRPLADRHALRVARRRGPRLALLRGWVGWMGAAGGMQRGERVLARGRMAEHVGTHPPTHPPTCPPTHPPAHIYPHMPALQRAAATSASSCPARSASGTRRPPRRCTAARAWRAWRARARAPSPVRTRPGGLGRGRSGRPLAAGGLWLCCPADSPCVRLLCPHNRACRRTHSTLPTPPVSPAQRSTTTTCCTATRARACAWWRRSPSPRPPRTGCAPPRPPRPARRLPRKKHERSACCCAAVGPRGAAAELRGAAYLDGLPTSPIPHTTASLPRQVEVPANTALVVCRESGGVLNILLSPIAPGAADAR